MRQSVAATDTTLIKSDAARKGEGCKAASILRERMHHEEVLAAAESS